MVNKVNRRSTRRKPGARPGRVIALWTLFVVGACLVLCFGILALPDLAQSLNKAWSSGGTPAAISASSVAPAGSLVVSGAPFSLKESMDNLAAEISKAETDPKLHAGVFAVEPESGRYIDMQGRRPYSAASMIKLPVLVVMLEALDAKKVDLKQVLAITEDLKGTGSGILQWRPVGSKISLNDCARLMITISDNTATNMIIHLLGGQAACNDEFAHLGLLSTRINNWLPDLSGTNTTSPYDLTLLLAKVDTGQVLSPSSRAWLFDTLEHNRIRTLLPMGIPRSAKIADKTGDIGTLVGDAGIITAANGKRYIVAVAVERPFNDRQANALIRTISKKVYAEVTADAQGLQQLEGEQKAAAAKAPVRKHLRKRSKRTYIRTTVQSKAH
jgi:beta-lactamase class A